MEKGKYDPEPSPNSTYWLLRLIVLLVFSCCGIIAILAFIGPYIGGGEIFPLFLAPRLVNIDKSLLNIPHQIEIPDENIELHLSVSPSTFNTGDIDICIEAIFHDRTYSQYSDFHSNSHFYVNGGYIFGTFYGRDSGNRRVSGGLDWCAYGKLKQGLHLIEFHLRDSSGETIHIQQWAIEVK